MISDSHWFNNLQTPEMKKRIVSNILMPKTQLRVCVCVCVCVPEVVDSSGGLVQLTLNLIQATGGLGLIDSHRVGVKRVIHAPV